jgi:hypothetical protein
MIIMPARLYPAKAPVTIDTSKTRLPSVYFFEQVSITLPYSIAQGRCSFHYQTPNGDVDGLRVLPHPDRGLSHFFVLIVMSSDQRPCMQGDAPLTAAQKQPLNVSTSETGPDIGVADGRSAVAACAAYSGIRPHSLAKGWT